MQKDQRFVSVGSQFRLVCVLLTAISVKQGFVADPGWYWLGACSAIAFVVSLLFFRKKQAVSGGPGGTVKTDRVRTPEIETPSDIAAQTSYQQSPVAASQRRHLRDKLLQ